MKSKTNENIAVDTETAVKPVATHEKGIADEATANDTDTQSFDVMRTEAVSIVANNRVLYFGKGVRKITVER